MLLERTQQPRLQFDGQFTDFIQKDGPRTGRRQQALSRLGCPGEAPLTCPNNSLSMRVGGSAPQSTGTKGRSRQGPCVWMARAANSLPVPLSPMIRTGCRCNATLAISR